jgi:hypothetical protein
MVFMERFLYFLLLNFCMKRGLLLGILVLLSVLLIACGKTQVVKPGDTPVQPPEQPVNETATPAETGPVENPIVKCADTDENEPTTVGRVKATYKDDTTKDFYDACIGGSDVLVEYFCDGNTVDTQNYICEEACITVNVKDPSCVGCKVSACLDVPSE